MRIRSSIALFSCATLAAAQSIGRIDQHVLYDEWYADWKVGMMFENGDVLTAIVRGDFGFLAEPGGIYLTRIRPDGSFAWSNYLEPVAPEQNFIPYQTGIAPCANGDFLLSGFMNMSVGYYRHFLARLDGTGGLIWSRSYDFIAELGDDEGTDALREHPDGTLSWMIKKVPSILMYLQSDGTLISATHYRYGGNAMLDLPAWDTDGGALFPCNAGSDVRAVMHVTADGVIGWSRRLAEGTYVSSAQRAANGDYILVGARDEQPAIMRIDATGEAQWGEVYNSGVPEGWLGYSGTTGLSEVIATGNDEYLANHFITGSDTNLVFLRISGSGVPLSCRRLVSATHAYEMHLVGVADGKAVLAGGEWDLTGADTSAFPIWRVPLDDPQNDPCGVEPQLVTHTAFVPEFDTITIEAVNSPVSNWELPLMISPAQLTTTDSCNPIGIEEIAHEIPMLWPVPLKRDGELFVQGLATDQVIMVVGLDGRVRTMPSRANGTARSVDLTGLAPGAYMLRTVGGIARPFVIAE